MAAISRGNAPDPRIYGADTISFFGSTSTIAKGLEGNWLQDLTLMSCTKPTTSWGSDCDERSA